MYNKIENVDEHILKSIKKRNPYANKGDYKKVLIIAGSLGMSGAAFLSALAAYRTGAGLVRIVTCEENRSILQSQLPEAIIDIYNYDGNIHDFIMKRLEWSDLAIIGCGLGNSEAAKALVEDTLKNYKKELIIDADALNILSKNKDLYKYLSKNMIITPHILEMSRLSGLNKNYINDNMIQVAYEFSRQYNTQVVLKSYKTIYINEKIYVIDLQAPALAKAGSGDVLTGIIAGMLCHGYDNRTAVCNAIYIHKKAAIFASRKSNEHSVIARDVIDNISEVFNLAYNI